MLHPCVVRIPETRCKDRGNYPMHKTIPEQEWIYKRHSSGSARIDEESPEEAGIPGRKCRQWFAPVNSSLIDCSIDKETYEEVGGTVHHDYTEGSRYYQGSQYNQPAPGERPESRVDTVYMCPEGKYHVAKRPQLSNKVASLPGVTILKSFGQNPTEHCEFCCEKHFATPLPGPPRSLRKGDTRSRVVQVFRLVQR